MFWISPCSPFHPFLKLKRWGGPMQNPHVHAAPLAGWWISTQTAPSVGCPWNPYLQIMQTSYAHGLEWRPQSPFLMVFLMSEVWEAVLKCESLPASSSFFKDKILYSRKEWPSKLTFTTLVPRLRGRARPTCFTNEPGCLFCWNSSLYNK